jgi:4-hydroxybenzoate polyprenyltransferase
MYVCIYVYTCVCLSVCVCVCIIRVCMCVCVCVCVCEYIYKPQLLRPPPARLHPLAVAWGGALELQAGSDPSNL